MNIHPQLMLLKDILSANATLLSCEPMLDGRRDLVFESMFGRYEGVYDSSIHQPTVPLQIGRQYHLEGWRSNANSGGYEFESIEPARSKRLAAIASSALPKPGKAIAQEIAKLLNDLDSDLVAGFANEALTLPSVLPRFLTMGASADYHHPGNGGLCRHSLECAQIVQSLPRHGFSTPLGRDIAIVAALLHDVGKVEAYGDGFRAADLPHEDRAAVLLARALESLTEKSRSAGELMRLLLNGSAKRNPAVCSPELVAVTFADRLSAAHDRAARSFAGAHPRHSVASYKSPYGTKRIYRAVF